MRSRALNVGLAIGLATSIVIPSDVSAFPRPDIDEIGALGTPCLDPGERVVRFAFEGPNWVSGSTDYRPAARLVVAAWETAYRRSDGLTIVDTVESNVSPYVSLQITNAPGLDPGNNGFTDCEPGNPANVVAQVNSNLLPTQAAFHDVLQHELGHAMGLWHTGSTDELLPGGAKPIMSTCLATSGDSSRALGNDDGGNLAHVRHADVIPNDSSFESGTSAWSATGGTLVRSNSSNYVLGGSWNARYTPSSGLNYLSQAMNYTWGPYPVGVSDAGLIGARVAYRKLTAAPSGQIRLIFEWRTVNYAASSSPCGGYVSGEDQNDREGVDAFIKWVDVAVPTPTTSWQIFAIPEPESLGTLQRDMRVGVVSTMQSGGTYSTVALDMLQTWDAGD